MPRICLALTIFAAVLMCTLLTGQPAGDERPNYRQAHRYSSDYLNQRIYSTTVEPNWVGETNRFWYSYRTSQGIRYFLVDPDKRTKEPLFDHDRLASLLSVELKKPLDAYNLSLTDAKIDEQSTKLSFALEKTKFELELATGALANLGPVPKEEQSERRRGRPTRGGSSSGDEEEKPKDPRAHRNFSPDHTAYVFSQGHNLYYVGASEELKSEILAIDQRLKEEKKAESEQKETEETEQKVVEKEDVKKEELEKEKLERKDVQQEEGDQKHDDGEKKVEKETSKGTGEEEKGGEDQEEEKVDEREAWADTIDESQALKLTDDGEEDYEFGSAGRRDQESRSELEEDEILERLQAGEFEYELPIGDDDESEEEGKEEEKGEEKSRPRISWAPDSTAFYGTRRDSRGVGELFLVNSLSEPRPTLETYDYALPGEEKIARSELFVFARERKTLFRVEGKWKDEGYQSFQWPKSESLPEPEDESEERDFTGAGDELRFIRSDRLLRNIELCSIDTRTGELSVLMEEGMAAANISSQSVRYLKKRDEMIWWSERSGWGHFYLYRRDGEFKNAITSGPFRASRIVELDEDKGLLYFLGNGREPGENVYFQHLYRVFLDGTGLTLMDPGNANHRSTVSPTNKYVVDNCSRIDMAPVSRLCDADGREVMSLEEADLSRLYESGWKMPETFTFKAADGVTDLYGNMWKPFDFDPRRKYPIIAEVYPGPQTEGVSHAFSSSNGRQQLAQIGFIVVQLGHRGGTPGRSKAYHNYGYFNLRDYGLADKKAGIEQLAERYPFIDIERVGLYGHSGGGFMTAAALMQKPYNDFFKVGVASSGNHDNNVYGRFWAERYHGLKEIEVKEEKKDAKRRRSQRDLSEIAARDDGDEDEKKNEKKVEKGDDEKKENGEGEKSDEKAEKKTKFEIHVPTNAELAENLKGNLLLVHGDMDSNVHPAGTMRLVDALIRANKRFDLLILPGKRHGYGDFNGYFTQKKWEFFAEHLLADHQSGADIGEKD